MLQDFVPPDRYTYLPNTAGCFTAQDAVRTLRLAREAGGWNLVKLEVLGPPPFLYPDMEGTLEAARALIAHTELSPHDVVTKSLEIAGESCIYTNQTHTIETLG